MRFFVLLFYYIVVFCCFCNTLILFSSLEYLHLSFRTQVNHRLPCYQIHWHFSTFFKKIIQWCSTLLTSPLQTLFPVKAHLFFFSHGSYYFCFVPMSLATTLCLLCHLAFLYPADAYFYFVQLGFINYLLLLLDNHSHQCISVGFKCHLYRDLLVYL